ncbi:MAG: hypothetical protein WC371_01470 [Parachlamydiales bacterium]|jgi:hypothetical protein
MSTSTNTTTALFAFVESVSSKAAGSLNNLRTILTKLVQTALEIEKKTTDVEKDLIQRICEAIRKAGKHESEKLRKQGLASVISGSLGLVTTAISAYTTIKSERTIAKSDRGLNKINEIKTALKANKGDVKLIDKKSPPLFLPKPAVMNRLDSKNLSAKQHSGWFKKTTNSKYIRDDEVGKLGALGKTTNTAQIDARLDQLKGQFENSRSTSMAHVQNMGMVLQTTTNSIERIASGSAELDSVDNVIQKAAADGESTLFKQISDTNQSLGRTEHDLASKFFDTVLSIERQFIDELNSVHRPISG